MKNVTGSLGFRLTFASYLVVAVFMSIAGVTVYRVSKDSIKMSAMTMVTQMVEDLALAPEASPEELGDRILRLKVRKSGSTWIMDREGNLLYNPDPLFREEYIAKKKNFGNVQVVLQAALPRASGQGTFKEKLVDIAQKYDEGFGTYKQFGEERILAFRSLPGRGLLVGVDESVSSANSELDRVKKYISYTALVSALLIMAFSMLSIRIIIRPYYREVEDLNASLQHSNSQLEDLNAKLTISNRNLTTVYEVGLGMRHSLLLRDILGIILSGAHQVLAVDRIAVFLPTADDKMLELRSWAGGVAPTGEVRVPLSAQGGALAAAFQRKEPLRVEEHQKIPPSLRLLPPAASDPFLRSRAFVVVPLVVKDRAIGVIAVDNKSHHEPIAQDKVHLLGIFANQAAVAVDNARLYDELRQKITELDGRIDQLSILHQISNSMQRVITRTEALGFILRGILEGIGFSQVAVALLNREEDLLQGELGLETAESGIKALRVPLAEEGNLLVMAAVRKRPVGIVHLGQSDLLEVIRRPLEEGVWQEGIGVQVPGAMVAAMVVPLIAREQVVGVIAVARTAPNAIIHRKEIELLLLYANTAGLTVERAELYSRMHQNLESLEITDHVSRLYTHRYGQQRAQEEIARCVEGRRGLAAVLIGIDAFKEYNDRFGHEFGDRSLEEISDIVRAGLRAGDLAFRYGGRLIALVLPGALRAEAVTLAEGIQERMRQRRFLSSGGKRDQEITVSVGLGAWTGESKPPGEVELFKMLLGYLHRAEAAGGNRIFTAEG